MNKISPIRIYRATIVVVIATASLIMSSQTGFSANWVTWDVSAGGNGHSYLAVGKSAGLTWSVANTQAQAQGGYLASITSAAENDFVYSLVNSSQFFSGINGAGPALGGYLDTVAGGWHWTSGEAWSYTNWYPGNPNNGAAGNDRLILWSNIPNTPAKTWDDTEPNDTNIGGYVIEVVPEPSSLTIIGLGSLIIFRRSQSKRK